MPLGLGASLSRAGIVTPGIITDGLVMRHMYSAGAVQKLSDGSAYFVGSNTDYILLNDFIVDTDGNCCIMFWWKYNGAGSSAWTIFGHTPTGNRFLRFVSGGDLKLESDDAGDECVIDLNTDFTDEQWHHYAVVCTSGTVTCFQDGVSCTIGSGADMDHDTTFRYIGAQGGSADSHNLDGHLCNLGVWSRACTQAEIKSIMFKQYADLTTSEKTSLTSWWNLDNNLTTQGSSSWVADEVDTTFDSNVTPTWTSSNGAVIDGQTITLGSSGVVSALATISPTGVYKVNVTVTGYTGSGNIEMPWDGSGSSNMQISANGTYEFYEKSSDTGWLIYAADGRGATITINSITKANGNIGELL